jgi:acyl-CoA thioesterase-1
MTRTVRAAFALLALLAFACSGQSDVPAGGPKTVSGATRVEEQKAAPKADVRRRIVFLGDSLTAGYGLAREQSVPALIQAKLNQEGYDYEVVNAGVSGDTSAGGLSRLDWSLDGMVDVLVIELGANDGLRGLPVAELRKNLDQIIRRAKARGVRVLLTGMEAPPNYGAAYTAEFRQVYQDLARAHQISFVPFYLAGVAGDPRLNIADGMHPNPEGARIVENTIWRSLESMIEKRPS